MQAVNLRLLTRCTVNPSQAAVRAGAGTPRRIRSCSGDVFLQLRATVELFLEAEADCLFSRSPEVNCRWRKRRCCSRSSSRATSCKNWSLSTSVSNISNRYFVVVFFFMYTRTWSDFATHPVSAGCLLTIILLMRALDPLGYEKETLAHFQTLKVCHRRAQQQQCDKRSSLPD